MGAADDVGAAGDDGANDEVPIAVDCVDAICDNGVSVFCCKVEKRREKKIEIYTFLWFSLLWNLFYFFGFRKILRFFIPIRLRLMNWHVAIAPFCITVCTPCSARAPKIPQQNVRMHASMQRSPPYAV